MSCPLRIEFEGALYHITSRGNARQIIYENDIDRHRFLGLLGREINQQRWFFWPIAFRQAFRWAGKLER